MIIAEIGQNWCGNEDLAKILIELAKTGGADLAKFQLYDSRKLYGEEGHSELSFEQAKMFFEYGKKLGIEVFFSVFDVERVKWCEEIGVKRYKISCESYKLVEWNRDLQRLLIPDFIMGVLGTGKEVFISTEDSLHTGIKAKSLYCIPHYPTVPKDIHFTDGMFEDENGGEYRKNHDGFSDHTIGLDASKVALARGARIIEKHFCINHLTGVDAAWSMNTEELKELVRFEKVCEECLG